MAKYETNSIGFPLTFNGPDTVEDYDRAAGKVGTCLEDAVENTIYRSTLPEWQTAFAPEVESLTGVKREVNAAATAAAKARSEKPDSVKDIMETIPRYVKRATAGRSDEDKTALAATAQRIADGITIDPSPSKRAAGIGKEYRAKADSLLTLPTDQLEEKITKMLNAVEGFDLERGEDNKPTTESLALLIKAWFETLL